MILTPSRVQNISGRTMKWSQSTTADPDASTKSPSKVWCTGWTLACTPVPWCRVSWRKRADKILPWQFIVSNNTLKLVEHLINAASHLANGQPYTTFGHSSESAFSCIEILWNRPFLIRATSLWHPAAAVKTWTLGDVFFNSACGWCWIALPCDSSQVLSWAVLSSCPSMLFTPPRNFWKTSQKNGTESSVSLYCMEDTFHKLLHGYFRRWLGDFTEKNWIFRFAIQNT